MIAWLPPVEASWRDVLAAALGRAITPSALATMVAKQSQAYLGEPVVLSPDDSRAARTLFWFPRDLPKPARAIAELHRAGALHVGRPAASQTQTFQKHCMREVSGRPA